MKKSRFTDAQMIGVLQEHEKGAKVPDLCRRMRHASTASPSRRSRRSYRRKRKYGGLQVSDAARLRQLEEENRRLPQLVAEQALDNRVLQPGTYTRPV